MPYGREIGIKPLGGKEEKPDSEEVRALRARIADLEDIIRRSAAVLFEANLEL